MYQELGGNMKIKYDKIIKNNRLKRFRLIQDAESSPSKIADPLNRQKITISNLMDMIEYINWVYEHGIKPAKPEMEDNKEISNFDETMSNLIQMKE